MKTTAVIIARFQTPFLHEGHRYLIETVKATHHRVVIVLGVSPVKGSRRNPYDFYTRERMLKKAYPGLFILPLADEASDKSWSLHLDDLLLNTFPAEPFTLYGSRNSFINAYNGKLPVEELPGHEDHSASALRAEHSDRVLDSEDFRMGINYAYHNAYAKVYPTVDVAVFSESRTQLLLGRKKGRAEWRLPGGFVDAGDANYEAAARRELREECGDMETGPMHYIGSAKIDDWRYRSEEDKIMTVLFATDRVYGHATAGDDLVQVEWFAVSGLQKMIEQNTVASEHQPLLQLLLKSNHPVNENETITQKN